MANLSQIILGLVVGIVVIFAFRKLLGASEAPNDAFTAAMASSAAAAGASDSTNILSRMKNNNKTVVVFYGSQTGTAEDFASKLAKDLSAKFGLKTMKADLEDYEYDVLDQFPEDYIAIFIMASYGEGEPTDNAVNFWQFLVEGEPEFSQGTSLENLHYAVFGLGNNTYEKFNEVGRALNKRLEELGAHRIGEYGEGDDGAGTMEEDYLAWSESFLHTLKEERNYEEHDYVYEPSIAIEEQIDLSTEDSSVFLGEPNKNHLEGAIKGPFNPLNPYLASVKNAYELFNSKDRNCVHLELDLGNPPNLRYTTGDHLALWAQNSNEEVDRLLAALGLTGRRHEVVSIKALDSTTQVRIPSPTTYDTVVRYFLEINGPVSRQVLSHLAAFAPSPAVKAEVKRLGGDKVAFHEEVANHYYNLSRLMLKLSNNKPWDVPFGFVIENLPNIQPRYYSISSSSGEDKATISITAVVERLQPVGSDFVLKGVATNEILDIKNAFAGRPENHYQLEGPRSKWASGKDLRVPVSVRHSSFKLPSKPETPIIMVGPGTGVAPYRGFIRERAQLAKSGKPVGRAVLFFGSRKEKEDALYSEEWPKYSSGASANLEGPFKADNFLTVFNAFSRDGLEKIYVQQRLKEQAKLVSDLLEQGAYFYVCGDASRMARDVQSTLATIISEERGLSKSDAEAQVKKWKTRNIYQEDVW